MSGGWLERRQGNNALTNITIWIIATLQLLCKPADLFSLITHTHTDRVGDKFMFLIGKYIIVKLITHILTLLSLSERDSLWESRMFLKRKLNSYTICLWWTKKSNCMNDAMWKCFICYFNSYILWHNGYKPCEHKDIERSNAPTPRTIMIYVVVHIWADFLSVIQVYN